MPNRTNRKSDFIAPQIDGYVLVGGKSSRMGTDKFALRFGGATFAERAAGALQKIAAGRVFFVVSADQWSETAQLTPIEIPRVADVLPEKAALGGIYTALAHAASEWIAVLACDLPFATKDLFIRLTETIDPADSKIAAVAPIQPDGRVQPLCALYRVDSCLGIAARLLESDRIPPARKLLEKAAARTIEFERLADLPGAERFFTNVNTPEDFLRLQN